MAAIQRLEDAPSDHLDGATKYRSLTVGIRQTINENPVITGAVTGGIILIALIFIVMQSCQGDPASGGPAVTKAFFTTDDGKTYFVDDAKHIPPYKVDKPGDPNHGKTAYRVQVFKCGDSAPFISHMEKYAEEDRKKLVEMMANAGDRGVPVPMMYMGGANIMIKKPGSGERGWVKLTPQTTQQYMNIMQPKCPDGTTNGLQRVMPE